VASCWAVNSYQPTRTIQVTLAAHRYRKISKFGEFELRTRNFDFALYILLFLWPSSTPSILIVWTRPLYDGGGIFVSTPLCKNSPLVYPPSFQYCQAKLISVLFMLILVVAPHFNTFSPYCDPEDGVRKFFQEVWVTYYFQSCKKQNLSLNHCKILKPVIDMVVRNVCYCKE